MKSRTGFAPLIVIAIVAAIILAGGVYFLAHKKANAPSVPTGQPAASSSSTTSAVDMSDWKTYTNTQYGFEVKIPQNFKINNDSSGFVIISSSGNSDENLTLTISPLEERATTQTLDQFVHGNLPSSQYNQQSTTTVNGLRTYKFHVILGSRDEWHTFFLKNQNEGVRASYTILYFRYNGVGYDPSDKQKFPDPANIQNPDITTFDQILSTFKFIPIVQAKLSGIKGTVTDTACNGAQPADPPPGYQPCRSWPLPNLKLDIKNEGAEGSIAKSVTTDAKAMFQVDLPPGTYTIVESKQTPARSGGVTVTVKAGVYTKAEVRFVELVP